MGLSKAEMETNINYNRLDENAEVYTSDSTVMTKLDKLVEKNPEQFKYGEFETLEGKVIAKRYIFPKRFITFRSKDMRLTDEQRAMAAERLRKARES